MADAVVAFLTLTRCTTLAARRTQANALGPLADTDRHLADLTTDDLDTALDNMAASPSVAVTR